MLWVGMGGRAGVSPAVQQRGAGEGTPAGHVAHRQPLWPPEGGWLLPSGTWQAQDCLQNVSRRLTRSWWTFVLSEHPFCLSFLFILSPPCLHTQTGFLH